MACSNNADHFEPFGCAEPGMVDTEGAELSALAISLDRVAVISVRPRAITRADSAAAAQNTPKV